MGGPARGRPGEVRRALALYQAPDLTIPCGRLLVVGMRACADLAERARARRTSPRRRPPWPPPATWPPGWTGWAVPRSPTIRTWRPSRRSGPAGTPNGAAWPEASEPAAWHAAAKAWEDLGCPHRAGYAWWRHAEARLLAGEPPAAVAATLRAAAAAADGHAPLLAAIHALAERARIPLDTRAAARRRDRRRTPRRTG